MDLSGLVDLVSSPGSFLREQMRGFHDLLRQNPTSLFILSGWSSISMAYSTLKMEAICSSETWLTQYLHGATSQKTAFFIVTAVKNSNLTSTV
jgi:hypothetical protein